MSTGADLQRSMQRLAQAGMWIDPVAREKAAYVRGDIEIEEFERRVGVLLGGKPVAYLQPGERVLTARSGNQL